jgi:RNA polymerase sigma-70 factor (ECF subfamily)
MADSPITRPSLLVRLRDAHDELAWSQFVDLYAPLVYGFARKHGLQDADAADLTQDVLRSVSIAAKKLNYDPQRGSFRGWLFTVVRNRLRDFWAVQGRQFLGSGGSDAVSRLQDVRAPAEDPAVLWEQDYERQLFNWAAAQVRPDFQETTWQAFWQTAVEGKSGKVVAKELGMTVAAVYLAKGRVIARLKEQVRQIHDE